MLWSLLAIIVGLGLLAWSADLFVDGAAALAARFGVPALLIGMVIVGFGTSLPEMVVSAIAAGQGNPGLALGNAYGSNIANIGLILGLTAAVCPLAVHSGVVWKELPILVGVTVLAAIQLWDGVISRIDAVVLLAVFAALMAWTVAQSTRRGGDPLESETQHELDTHPTTVGKALTSAISGLIILVVSSRLLVWGAAHIAAAMGVTDLIIGLTIVAVGTSLPELASSLAAIRKGQDDIAFGNVLGSNLFNTLAVVGIAGVIEPIDTSPEVLHRDVPVMGLLTVSLFAIGYRLDGARRIGRVKAVVLLLVYAGYIAALGLSTA